MAIQKNKSKMQSTFNTHRLKKKSLNCYELVPAHFSNIFFAIFIIIGCGIGYYGVSIKEWGLILFGTVFAIIPMFGGLSIKTSKFDADLQKITLSKKQLIDFDDVQAIKIEKNRSMYSLHLITKDGEDFMLAPSLFCNKAQEISQKLTDLLGCSTLIDDTLPQKELQAVKSIQDIDFEHLAWSPVASGGTNMRTHKFAKVNEQLYYFKASFGLGTSLFLLPFMIGGCVGAIFSLYNLYTMNWATGLFFLVWSSLFGMPLWWFIYLKCHQPIFDLSSMSFWKGKLSSRNSSQKELLKSYVNLANVVALQILTESCTGGKGASYLSYELNLVLQDNSRVNVVDHGSYEIIKKDATLLGELLNINVIEK